MALPKFLVLCIDDRDIQILHSTLSKSWPAHSHALNLTTIHENLRNLPNSTKFDLIVSPANSYGILDGGFDDAISRTFCLPQHDYRALTNVAQQKLYEQWHGFAPPGTCTLVSMPSELREKNRWGCKLLALCPTMRTPSDARWDREVVYECVWSLMCEVDRWNKNVSSNSTTTAEEKIETILITPLATGTGGVSREKWALQFVLALKHFVDAQEKHERWSRLKWEDLTEAKEVERSWQM